MTGFLPGTQVVARGLRWEVVFAQPAGEQTLLRLRSMEIGLQGQERQRGNVGAALAAARGGRGQAPPLHQPADGSEALVLRPFPAQGALPFDSGFARAAEPPPPPYPSTEATDADNAASSATAHDPETYELIRMLLDERGVIASIDAQALTGLDAAAATPTPAQRIKLRMREQGFVTNADWRDMLGVARSQAAAALQALVASGVLRTEGMARSRRYLPGPAWASWSGPN